MGASQNKQVEARTGAVQSGLWKRLAHVLATAFYTGYAPVAPGTFGSLLALVIYWLFYPPPPGGHYLILGTWATLVLVVVLGILVAHKAEEFLGHDGSPIVIDEVAGMLITVAFLPKILWLAVVGFFVFRALDIVKPFPAGRSQRLPGGWGVMADDVICGIYANVILRVALLLSSRLAS